MPTSTNAARSALRKSSPAATSSYFTLRILRAESEPLTQVSVPVRVESSAAKRNRIRRQVTEALRNIRKQSLAKIHIAVMVRRPDIPRGEELQSALFELLRESGMIEQQ